MQRFLIVVLQQITFVLNYKICPKFLLTVMLEIVSFEFSGCTFLMEYLLLVKRDTDAVYVQ